MNCLKRILVCITFLLICFCVVSCRAKTEPLIEGVDYIYVGEEAKAPEGVVRYCWEEPIVAFEKNSPGVDGRGDWYVPEHTRVHMVRGGRWRPCIEERDESAELLEKK